jgi:hypothetical protein
LPQAPAPAPAPPPAPSRSEIRVPTWAFALAAGVVLGAGALWAGNLLGPGEGAAELAARTVEPAATLSAAPPASPIIPPPPSPTTEGIAAARGAGGHGLLLGEQAETPAPAPVVQPGANRTPPPAQPAAKRRLQTHAASPSYSGGRYGTYPAGHMRARFEAVRPRLDPCFAPHRFSTVDHRYTDWRISIAHDGVITAVEPANEMARAIPELARCVSQVLQRHLDMGPPPNANPIVIQLDMRAEPPTQGPIR